MPAKSKSQQRLFGMVHAYQKGRLKHAPASVKRIAKHISEEDAEHFAKTRHKGLPETKKAEVKPMTRYEQGFLRKCAEYQIPDDEALSLYYKWRLGDSKSGPYDVFDQNPRFGGYRIPAGAKYYKLLSRERKDNGNYVDHYPLIRAGLAQQSAYLGDRASEDFLDSEARRIASDYNLRGAGVDTYAARTPEVETAEQLAALKDRYEALSARTMRPGDRVVPTPAASTGTK